MSLLRQGIIRAVQAFEQFSHLVPFFRSGDVMIEDYLQRHLFLNPKYQDPLRLNRFESQIFSQNGEDGIIAEIFRRIGTTNQKFIEIGAADGLENNTAALLFQGWSGVWWDGNPALARRFQKQFRPIFSERRLKFVHQWIQKESLDQQKDLLEIEDEVDLLSIDIDGNDYWIWQGIQKISPRVVVIEYNAQWGASTVWCMEYNPRHSWDGSSYYGASLKALELLAAEKGYSLVGCGFMGVNAFFVRNDCLKDRFLSPATSESHFEPFRMFLYRRSGYPRKIGRFIGEKK